MSKKRRDAPWPSWLPRDKPRVKGKKTKQRTKSNGELMEEVIIYLRCGFTAYQAAAQIGKSKRWLWRQRRVSPLFSRRVAVLDRIVRNLRPGDDRALWDEVKTKTIGDIEEDVFTRKQRLRSERELVELKDKEAFLAIYRETTDRATALDRLGLKAKQVEDALMEDPTFSDDFDEEQLRVIWAIEDAEKRRALEDGAAARFLLKSKTPKQPKMKRTSKTPEKAIPSWADDNGMKNAEGWAEGSVGFGGEKPS